MNYDAFYDVEFNVTRYVKVKFTNVFDGMTRIVSADKASDISLSAYQLDKINDKYYAVVKTEDTTQMLDAMCHSVKPKEWK